MTRCLGWPNRDLGLADIVALRASSAGWAAYACSKPEWGKTPLLSFTDPRNSSTARNVLLALYAMAAGKEAEELNAEDVADPTVVEYVRDFQRAVDHYESETVTLTDKMTTPGYVHFSFIPENSLATR